MGLNRSPFATSHTQDIPIIHSHPYGQSSSPSYSIYPFCENYWHVANLPVRWSRGRRSDVIKVRPSKPRSLADRTPICGLWDGCEVEVGDDPVRTIIGVNIVHGHFDTRSLPAAGCLLRQITLVNNL